MDAQNSSKILDGVRFPVSLLASSCDRNEQWERTPFRVGTCGFESRQLGVHTKKEKL